MSERMTTQELRNHKDFGSLPIYMESDDRCDELLRCHNSEFDGTIYEAEDKTAFMDHLMDESLEIVGAIEYSQDDTRPIFWRRRNVN